METATALDTVKKIIGIIDTSNDELLTIYINMAANEIISWHFGGDSTISSDNLPVSVVNIQIMAVVEAWNKRGAEGEKAHSSSSISHTFAYDDMVSYIHNKLPCRAVIV